MAVIGEAWVAIRPEMSQFASEAKSKIGDAMKNPLAIAGAAVAAVGASVTAFAAVSINKFQSVAGEVKKLSLITGESTESMSRLRFAAQQSGVSADSLGSAIKKLSVGISTNSKAVQDSGVAFRDAQGHVLPMSEALKNVADKFEKMPNGIDKNTEAVQLFGKQGLELLPFLNKGRDGLDELSKKSDAFGETLSGKSLDAIKQNAQAHKDFSAAMEGLQLRIGSLLMPVIADFATFIAAQVVPIIVGLSGAVGDLAGWLGEQLAPVWGKVQDAAARLVSYLRDVVWKWVVSQWQAHKGEILDVWDKLRDAFTKVKDKINDDVLPKLKDLADFVVGPLLTNMKQTVDFLNNNFGSALSGANLAAIVGMTVTIAELSDAMKILKEQVVATSAWRVLTGELALSETALVGTILPVVAVAAGIAALVAAAIYAYTHFKGFREVVDEVAHALVEGLGAAVDWLQKNVLPALIDFAGFVIEQFGHLLKFAQEEWPAFAEAVTHVFDVIWTVVGPIVGALVQFVQLTFEGLQAFWAQWGDTIITYFKALWDILYTVVSVAINTIKDVIKFVLDVINGDWGKAWHDLVDLVGNILGGVLHIVGDILKVLGSAISSGMDMAKSFWSDRWKQFGDVFPWISGKIEEFVGFLGGLGGKIGRAVSGMWNGIVDGFRAAINNVIDLWNRLELRMPEVDTHIPGVGKVGGFALSTPDFPHLATGGVASGLALVGERGPELVNFNSTARVFPNEELMAALGGMMQPSTYIENLIIHNNKPLDQQLAEVDRLRRK